MLFAGINKCIYKGLLSNNNASKPFINSFINRSPNLTFFICFLFYFFVVMFYFYNTNNIFCFILQNRIQIVREHIIYVFPPCSSINSGVMVIVKVNLLFLSV